MRRAILAACVMTLAACWKNAPPIEVAGECAQDDLRVQVEVGYGMPPVMQREGGEYPWGCWEYLATLQTYRALYEKRFGHVDLSNRVVRMRAKGSLTDESGITPPAGWIITGITYGDAIDLARDRFTAFPHELNHVRTGHSHDGWCDDYNPWSIEVLGIDQSEYLGCH